ncbi:hypothetical protein GCM10027597_37520 [Saccharopolyspora tripterygii]
MRSDPFTATPHPSTRLEDSERVTAAAETRSTKASPEIPINVRNPVGSRASSDDSADQRCMVPAMQVGDVRAEDEIDQIG